MNRFFLLNTMIEPGQSVDLSPLAHQLLRVLRLNPGQQILLLDGENTEYLTEITTLARRQASGTVLSRHRVEREPSSRLTLYQCSLKADKFEWVLQKGTELGLSAFTPVISERSVVRPAATLLKKYDRWRTIIREAAEQSGRGRLPALNEPLSITDAIQFATGLRYLPWEEMNQSGEAVGLGTAVDLEKAGTQMISMMIGPEGGLTAGEAGVAVEAGWRTVSLGPRILRAETAALAGIAIIMERLAELGS